MPALALDPERTTLSEDGRLSPAGLSPITELLAGDLEVTMLSAGLESDMTLPVIGKSAIYISIIGMIFILS